MSERPRVPSVFSTPQEEIAFLRERIALRERELLGRTMETDHADYETLARQALREYGEHTPETILHDDHRIDPVRLAGSVELVSTAKRKVEEVVEIARKEGIRNALSILEKIGDSYLTDEVHRALVYDIKNGLTVADLKEGVPPWGVLHMTLFEVALPEARREENKERALKEIISAMEQFYAGMRSISSGTHKHQAHYTLEIAVSDKSDDIIFYVSVPTSQVTLFEKHVLSLFPNAIVTEQKNDYNIFVEGGVSLVSVGTLAKHHIYPIRLYESFDQDPLHVLLNTFSKIERDGGGAAVQIAIRAGGSSYQSGYESITKRVRDGMPVSKAIRLSTFGGRLLEDLREMVTTEKKKDDAKPSDIDQNTLQEFARKMDRPIVETTIRIAVSARSEVRATQILTEIESSFHQFENTKGNRIQFLRPRGGKVSRELKAFSFREFNESAVMPLSIAELTTLIHFPVGLVTSSPQFKQSRAKVAAAPVNMPQEGTLLGVNTHRGGETPVYLSPEDRLRHFYIIGQTGTGKTTLLKNMITQDIRAGHGVCMIDPHGTDIKDVLAAVPKEREKDVIYFDPSYMDSVMGLNMLEFDPRHPEQKTFVVNELFSIFQKLYGAVPESMGPMFEQYFRNATLLVLEDPESGSTLLDISRVMADAQYRRMKLAKAKNPVVVQFWTEIASKAGGEAALENIVPYITSKFDIFTANDYMRPIIGQQSSSFNFREIMDTKKILLVNLSKGRLGDINANLIGMIVVGKILMAALSRVDTSSKSLPPFYLHIDEFQNITTDSIASILSEARKYKLGLTLAHQYIEQIDEKIRDAVFGNVGSLAAFRVGPEDAEFLEKQFAPVFEAGDLMNIENYHACVRILAGGTPTKPFSIRTVAPEEGDPDRIVSLIASSYARYGTPRHEVEESIAARYRASARASIPVTRA